MKFSAPRTTKIALSLLALGILTTGVAAAHDESDCKGGRHHGMFERMDANGDGKITKTEARQVSEQHFKKLDANSDGSVTKAELEAAHEKMRTKRGKDDEDRHDKKEGHHPRGAHFFEKMDANKDGKITLAEAQKAADERFGKFDGNKDGVVTREEADAAHEARKEERREKRDSKN